MHLKKVDILPVQCTIKFELVTIMFGFIIVT